MLKKRPACPVETTLSVIGNKWKLLILRDLLKGTLRFGQLKSSIGSVSQKVLTAQLRAMEAHREVYAEVPPRVECSLTETGLSLAPVIEAMSDWGQTYQEKHADLFEEG
ncbi:TPA: helix-turn-helix transcriptional regulator [Streptococcus pyogenes]|uniref:winged helix-turn-helix transcriptional regulator n=1 Tax=Streptococcus pyogenes TaxID=1314 RepID=UPI0003B989C5|nr:helix-turn-helix domain-containing protein [Streptococcus pyogenes]ESA51927.1 HTH-type transcriptional activator HxlR [Streptococcus pyogenes GA40056]HER4567899.1 helix-turn-helix transcriptional regulator [Streptococcus pyogenes NGAS640]HER4607330.1 helix-turn-helix transcriptional regulator [Streptococcus pyogenes NGAS532]EMC5220116.1 helix-turn-helix transcriptional regulator [Streptococcus pyogenes]NAZ90515.1 transcriptional regulator [Streptococcus pyogenes]